jgi:DNA-binding GntR family transcriptional regulator
VLRGVIARAADRPQGRTRVAQQHLHGEICRFSGNALLTGIMDSLRTAAVDLPAECDRAGRPTSWAEHEALAVAIINGDASPRPTRPTRTSMPAREAALKYFVG